MSYGDQLIGIKTIYKGIQMRSKLETKIAFLLDGLGIKWEYEPKSFMLSEGFIYIPDFYLPEIKTWIEVKGVIMDNNMHISKLFSEENDTELLLISPDKNYWFTGGGLVEYEEIVYLSKCSHCNSFFFCGYVGSYHCRKCNAHEGDHDIMTSLNESLGFQENVDFSNIDDIKKIVSYYGNPKTKF